MVWEDGGREAPSYPMWRPPSGLSASSGPHDSGDPGISTGDGLSQLLSPTAGGRRWIVKFSAGDAEPGMRRLDR